MNDSIKQNEAAPALGVAPGSAEQRALSLEAAILWGEGDESLQVSLGVAAAMGPTDDEGSTAARLLATEVRRLREALYAVTTQLEHVEDLRRLDCGPIPATLSPDVIAAAKILLPNIAAQTTAPLSPSKNQNH